MPILFHGLGVLSNIDQLRKGQNNYLMRLIMSHRATRSDDDDDYGDDDDDDKENTDNSVANRV